MDEEKDVIELDENEDIYIVELDENEDIDVIELDENEDIGNVALKNLLKGEKGDTGEPGKSGTSSYANLNDLPEVNGILIKGKLTTEDLKLLYSELFGLPTLNGKKIVGDLTTEDLGIETGSDIGILTEFDIEYTYEDNEVYNANAIHQLMEIFGFEIMNLVEVLENHEERIAALEKGG